MYWERDERMKKKSGIILEIVICVLIVAIGIAGIYYCFFSKKGNDSDARKEPVNTVQNGVENEDATDFATDNIIDANAQAQSLDVAKLYGAGADMSGVDDNKEYTVTYSVLKEMSLDDYMVPTVKVTASGSSLKTLLIGGVDDNPLLSEKVPGIIGHAYNFFMQGDFKDAKIIFYVDKSAVDVDKNPVICRYNDKSQLLEPLETSVNDNEISADLTAFSKYVLIYRDDWESAVAKSISDKVMVTGTGIDLASFLNLDESDEGDADASLDDILVKDNDTDGDGINNGEEIIIKKAEGLSDVIDSYAFVASNPLEEDTDGDGFTDGEESKMGSNPMCYDVTDLTLEYAAWLSYYNVGGCEGRTVWDIGDNEHEKLESRGRRDFADTPYEALKNFEVEYCNESGDNDSDDYGLGLTVIKKRIDGRDNYIVCLRGTEVYSWEDIVTDLTIGMGIKERSVDTLELKNVDEKYTYTQLEEAVKICDGMMEEKSLTHCKWYVTGHSLGGRLAQDVYLNTAADFDAGATFNGLGYMTKEYKDMEDGTIEGMLGDFNVTENLMKIDDKDEFLVFVEALRTKCIRENPDADRIKNKLVKLMISYWGARGEGVDSMIEAMGEHILDDFSLDDMKSNNAQAWEEASALYAKKGGRFNSYYYYGDVVGDNLGNNDLYSRIGNNFGIDMRDNSHSIYDMCHDDELKKIYLDNK